MKSLVFESISQMAVSEFKICLLIHKNENILHAQYLMNKQELQWWMTKWPHIDVKSE